MIIYHKFFQYYANFNWKDPINFIDPKEVECETLITEQSRKTPITILQSVYPYHNTSRNVSEKYAGIIQKEFKNAHQIKDNWNFQDESDQELYELCEAVCKINQPNLNSKQHLIFKLFCNDKYDSHHIFSLMKSKTQGLVTSIDRIVGDGLRVYPVFVHFDVTSQNEAKFNNLYEYYMVFDVLSMNRNPLPSQFMPRHELTFQIKVK